MLDNETQQQNNYWEKIHKKKNAKKKKDNDASRRDIMQQFNIGNASDIGHRQGEKKYEAVGYQKEEDEENRVSILKKKGNLGADIHMKIIKQHKIQKIR